MVYSNEKNYNLKDEWLNMVEDLWEENFNYDTFRTVAKDTFIWRM